MEVIDAMNFINSTMHTKKCFGEQLKIIEISLNGKFHGFKQ